MKKLAILILIAVSFAACEPHAYYSQLLGSWNASDWTVAGSDKNLSETTTFAFTFNADKTYEMTLGSSNEKGTYKCVQDLIRFFPEGKTEIPVQVLDINSDYLQIKMDNNGQEEIVTFKRVE